MDDSPGTLGSANDTRLLLILYFAEATASEPLTLEQEFENQQSWHTDEKSASSFDLVSFLTPQNAPLSFWIALNQTHPTLAIMAVVLKSHPRGLLTRHKR